jgi:hypothetical protein
MDRQRGEHGVAGEEVRSLHSPFLIPHYQVSSDFRHVNQEPGTTLHLTSGSTNPMSFAHVGGGGLKKCS